MSTTSTMLKIAYLKGLEQAAEQYGHELNDEPKLVKEAILGALARGALKWGIGKPLGAAGKMLGRQALHAGKTVGKATGREAWRFGKNIAGMGMKDKNQMSKLFRGLTFGGRNVPAQMLQQGTAFGALGGLTGGKPGEGWSWSGAGKGFLGGAASGLGWAAGGRLARSGLSKALAKKPFQTGRLAGFADRARNVSGIGSKGPSLWGQRAWDKAPGKSFSSLWKGTPTGGAGQSVMKGLGSTAKDIGTKAALGVPILAGTLGTSVAAEEAMRLGLGDNQSALSPESMAARGAFSVYPQTRRTGY